MPPVLDFREIKKISISQWARIGNKATEIYPALLSPSLPLPTSSLPRVLPSLCPLLPEYSPPGVLLSICSLRMNDTGLVAAAEHDWKWGTSLEAEDV